MRVAFLGNAPWSVPSLEALAGSSHDVVAVVTRRPRPAGRGKRLTPTPVAGAARRLGLPLAEVESVKSSPGLQALAGAGPDALAVVAYGEILPQAVLDVPRLAPVNVHFSLLPELRGAAPVQRAILEGLPATGVTTIRMDAGMDTGPVLLVAEEAIDPEDDSGSLGARLAALGGRLLVDTLDRLEAGTLDERPQDDEIATYAPKLARTDRVIDWREPADRVVRRIRAFAPEPGAITTFRGRTLKLLGARVATRGRRGGPSERAPVGGEPGRAAIVSKGGLTILAEGGEVELLEVAPESRRRMSGAEFVRGYGPSVGEAFGRDARHPADGGSGP